MFFDMIDAAPELPFYGVVGALLVVIGIIDQAGRGRWS